MIQHNRVLSITQQPDGEWLLETEKGPIRAEHVVNAGGLWARQVGRMVGIDLPLIPMQHHFLVTEDVPEVAALDRTDAGSHRPRGLHLPAARAERCPARRLRAQPQALARRRSRLGLRHGADPRRGRPHRAELSIGFERFPALQRVGIKRWVNGGITFTPDGNPLVGPVPGRRNFWSACGVMAGFSQGAGIGLALANWIVDGDPGDDVFGMDITRFGPFATDDSYLRATTAQFYARRFLIAYPNEELPAGRPLKTSPVFPDLLDAGARCSVVYGLEVAQYFAPDADFEENLTWRRSNAHAIVGEEVAATRAAAGLYETTAYARYEVTGPGAAAWLDHIMASALPAVGRIKLAPMLNQRGHLMGDLTVSRLADDRFWVTGSYYLQEWHQRWFAEHLPADGSVQITNLCDDWCGFSLSGPKSREILQQLVDIDLSHASVPFLSVREATVAGTDAVRRPHLAHRRARLRGHRPRSPAACASRRAARSRRATRHATDRRPRNRQPAAGEGLRHLVDRVHPGVHTGDVWARRVRCLRQGGLRRAGRSARSSRVRAGPPSHAAVDRRHGRRCVR